MTREYEALLRLAGAFVRREAPGDMSGADWAKLTQLAHIHDLRGLLGYMAMSYPVCPDARLRASLREVCLGTIQVFGARASRAGALQAALARQGIDHVAMKGIVLRELFPVPELRTFGDVDLVIRPEDRATCHRLMLDLGYRTEADWEPVFSYRREGEYYEIHTEIMEVDVSDRADYRAYFHAMWDHAVREADHSFRFRPEFEFIYMLTHIAKHITGSGAGLRMYLDVAVFIEHYRQTLDWDYVKAELEKLALADFAGVVLTFVSRYLGVESPVELPVPEEPVLELFLEFTMAGGVFGKSAEDLDARHLATESRRGEENSRTGTLLRRIFPPATSIQGRYTYLQDKPWLLPAAWVHRLVITRDRWDVHSREARDILSADMDKVKGLNRLLRAIGL